MEDFVVMDLSNMSERVRRAFDFAEKYHQGQKRKGGNDAYIVHPYRVWKVVKEFSKDDEIAECAALLHDTVEDSEATIEDIKMQFGPFIANVVAEVSLSKEDKNNLTWAQKKAKTISHVPTLSLRGQLVELADKYSNARDLPKLYDKEGNLNFQSFHETSVKQQEWYYRSLYEAFQKSARLKSVQLLADQFGRVIDFGFGRSYHDYLNDEESQKIKEENMEFCCEKEVENKKKEGPLFIEVMGTPWGYSKQLVEDIVDALEKRNLSISILQGDMTGERAFDFVEKFHHIKDNLQDDVVLFDCGFVQSYIELLLKCNVEIKKDPSCVYDIVEDLHTLKVATTELLDGVIGIYGEEDVIASKVENGYLSEQKRNRIELYNNQFYESLHVCAEGIPHLLFFEPNDLEETSLLVSQSVQFITSQLVDTKKKTFVKTTRPIS